MGQILSDIYDTYFGSATYWETHPANSIFTGEDYILKGEITQDDLAFVEEMNAYSEYFYAADEAYIQQMRMLTSMPYE
jgi:hypothetical protein